MTESFFQPNKYNNFIYLSQESISFPNYGLKQGKIRPGSSQILKRSTMTAYVLKGNDKRKLTENSFLFFPSGIEPKCDVHKGEYKENSDVGFMHFYF